MNTEKDEIDLYLLLRKGVMYLIKNKLILFGFLILGFGIGYFRVKENPDKYNNFYLSHFYIESNTVSQEMLFVLINNLNFEFEKISKTRFDSELIEEIKSIEAVKELSIDGLRSNLRVDVETRSPLGYDFILELTSFHIKSAEYFTQKSNVKKEDLIKVLSLLDSELDSLGLNLGSDNLSQIVKKLSANKPQNYLAYVNLVEKKISLEREVDSLNDSLKFIPVEPKNKFITTTRLQVLTCLGYSMLMILIGLFVLQVKAIIKKK
tara:strand:+ start:5061 stop:5852 length:792 start_codon:yes stop_codon:yes gene_type:complete